MHHFDLYAFSGLVEATRSIVKAPTYTQQLTKLCSLQNLEGKPTHSNRMDALEASTQRQEYSNVKQRDFFMIQDFALFPWTDNASESIVEKISKNN